MKTKVKCTPTETTFRTKVTDATFCCRKMAVELLEKHTYTLTQQGVIVDNHFKRNIKYCPFCGACVSQIYY